MADEVLAVAGGAHGHSAIVGIGAGTDDGGIAHAARQLLVRAAGAGGSSQVAVQV